MPAALVSRSGVCAPWSVPGSPSTLSQTTQKTEPNKWRLSGKRGYYLPLNENEENTGINLNANSAKVFTACLHTATLDRAGHPAMDI